MKIEISPRDQGASPFMRDFVSMFPTDYDQKTGVVTIHLPDNITMIEIWGKLTPAKKRDLCIELSGRKKGVHPGVLALMLVADVIGTLKSYTYIDLHFGHVMVRPEWMAIICI